MKELALHQVKAAHALAEACIANRIEAIRIARELSISWEQIGDALGMSRQTAYKHFGQAIRLNDES